MMVTDEYPEVYNCSVLFVTASAVLVSAVRLAVYTTDTVANRIRKSLRNRLDTKVEWGWRVNVVGMK